MTKGSGWADLPQDVVQHLVSLLKTKDFCQVWLLSRNWASCSRQITTPPMIIPSSQATLSGKLATLASWTQAGRFANSEFSFQTDKSMTVLELRNTIKALTQVYQAQVLFSFIIPNNDDIFASVCRVP